MHADDAKSDDDSLETLSVPSNNSRRWLRQNIKSLRERRPGELTSEYLGNVIGKNDHKINNFLRGTAKLDDLDHKKLVEYVFDQKPNWSSGRSQERTSALFHSLVGFLEVHEQTLNHLAAQAPGLYTVWRASTHIPGKYVKGMIRIEHEKSLNIVTLQETQRYKGGDGTTPVSEVFDGFIVKKSRHYVMITRQMGHSGPPRMTIIDNVLYDEAHKILVMQGMTTGSYGANELFCAPIYLERSSKEAGELEQELDIVDDIPASVKAKLDATVSHGIIWF